MAFIITSDKERIEATNELAKYVMSQKNDKRIPPDQMLEVVKDKRYVEKRRIIDFDFRDLTTTVFKTQNIEKKEEYKKRLLEMGNEERAKYFCKNWVMMLWHARNNEGEMPDKLKIDVYKRILEFCKKDNEGHVPGNVYQDLIPHGERKCKNVGKWVPIGELMAK